MKRILIVIFLIAVVVLIAKIVLAGTLERVSVNDAGTQANNDSYGNQTSSDGRYVVFLSSASNIVSGDTNNVVDVFVHDRDTGVVERVSVSSAGAEGAPGSTSNPSISADGRYVSFDSEASNLVLDDTNGLPDIFIRDRDTDTTVRISVDSDEIEADGVSLLSSISADGRYVAFTSSASNLLGPDDTNGLSDVFVRDRDPDEDGVLDESDAFTERVSIASDGLETVDGASGSGIFGMAMSGDGRYVVFDSDATTLVPDDTNGEIDVFVYDRQTNTIERVSVDSDGLEGNNGSSSPEISADGRYVVFISLADNLINNDDNVTFDVFVYDREKHEIERASVDSNGQEANNGSVFNPAISADGRYVVFSSLATNLVVDDTNSVADVFVHDRQTGETERVSVNEDGEQANALSIYQSDISADGRYVVFPSNASNLVDNDTNGKIDIFLYDRQDEDVENISDSNNTSGYQMPNIRIKDRLTETSSRFVNLEVFAPFTILRFEISNTSDFSTKETYIREYTQKDLYWDLCKGIGCTPGMKRIYGRFYNEHGEVFEDYVDINYINKECPYFKSYLRIGYKNDSDEVIKAQEFLNREIDAELDVDGIFGEKTDQAVRHFQSRYPTEIIFPWPTLKNSTGFWFITTTAYANFLVGC